MIVSSHLGMLSGIQISDGPIPFEELPKQLSLGGRKVKNLGSMVQST